MSNIDHFSESRPNVGVTVAAISLIEGQIRVLTYVRPDDAEFFPGKIALPNGFMDITKHRTLEEATEHALLEKTRSKLKSFINFNVFSGTYIDPRRITVNVGFVSFHNLDNISFIENDKDSKWISIHDLLQMSPEDMAFNHHEVLVSAWDYIKNKSLTNTIYLDLLEKEFSFGDIMAVLNLIFSDRKLNEQTLRKRIKASKVIIETGNQIVGKKARPTALYRKNKDKVILELP